MAGTSEIISIEVRDRELQRALGELVRDVQNPTPALRGIGEVMVASTKQRFAEERAPDGSPWAPNSDVTLLNYLRRRGGISRRRGASGGRTLTSRGARALGAKKILTDSGRLSDSIAYQITDGGRGVAVGTNAVYGAMHQFGGTKSQHSQLWGDIPARPFLGVSRDDREAIFAVLRRYIDRSA